jgi:hypothetical protein
MIDKGNAHRRLWIKTQQIAGHAPHGAKNTAHGGLRRR